MKKIKILPIGIILFGVLLGGVTTAQALYYSPQEEIPTPVGVSLWNKDGSLPIHLSIPKINIESEIELVGITKKGNMSTPKKIYNTGWYKYGTVPGNIGSAVIDGHVDNGFGTAGVFSNLKTLTEGDEVFVINDSGEKLRFVVYKVESYYYKNVPLEEVFNKNDDSYLNLITCDGDWLPHEETSDRRVVVYSRLVKN